MTEEGEQIASACRTQVWGRASCSCQHLLTLSLLLATVALEGGYWKHLSPWKPASSLFRLSHFPPITQCWSWSLILCPLENSASTALPFKSAALGWPFPLCLLHNKLLCSWLSVNITQMWKCSLCSPPPDTSASAFPYHPAAQIKSAGACWKLIHDAGETCSGC